ncbi:hypothetical protein EJB05_31987, partial [Eragrostis curvula]
MLRDDGTTPLITQGEEVNFYHLLVNSRTGILAVALLLGLGGQLEVHPGVAAVAGALQHQRVVDHLHVAVDERRQTLGPTVRFLLALVDLVGCAVLLARRVLALDLHGRALVLAGQRDDGGSGGPGCVLLVGVPRGRRSRGAELVHHVGDARLELLVQLAAVDLGLVVLFALGLCVFLQDEEEWSA